MKNKRKIISCVYCSKEIDKDKAKTYIYRRRTYEIKRYCCSDKCVNNARKVEEMLDAWEKRDREVDKMFEDLINSKIDTNKCISKRLNIEKDFRGKIIDE